MKTLDKQQKKRLKSLSVSLMQYIRPFELRHYGHLILEYRNDLIKADFDKIAFWQQFGECTRKRIENRHHHQKACLFGFTEVKLDEHGWFERPELNDIEHILFETNQDRYYCNNYVTVARGNNQIWTYSVHYDLGSASGGYAPCVFGQIFQSRDEAINAGIDELKARHIRASKRIDTAYNQSLINAVLKSIEKYKADQQQLSLF